jgi:hypothetical protein
MAGWQEGNGPSKSGSHGIDQDAALAQEIINYQFSVVNWQ